MEYQTETYSVKLLSQDTRKDWDDVLKNSNETGFFHDLALNKFYAKKNKASDISFIVYNTKENKPLVICPLFIIKEKYNKVYRPDKTFLRSNYTSGPAFINYLSDKKRREIIYFLSDYFNKLQNHYKADQVRLGNANLSDAAMNSENSTNPLHELRSPWVSETLAYYYLNLKVTEEELLKNLETRTRTIINKFLKGNEFNFRKGTSADLDIVYDLFLKTQKRNHMQFHDKETFKWYLDFIGSNHFIAESGDKAVSVINIGTYNNQGIYWSSFTDEDFLKTEIATYLLWYSIMEAKRMGIEHFELGDQPFLAKDNKFDSIASFKRSFGGVLRYKFFITLEKKGTVKKILNKLVDIL